MTTHVALDLDPEDAPPPAICPVCWRLFCNARVLAVAQQRLAAIYQYCPHRNVLVIAGFGRGWKITSWNVISPIDEAAAKKLLDDSAKRADDLYGKPSSLAGTPIN